MKMTQISNTGMKNWKKRKLKTSGNSVSATKLDNKFVDKPLHSDDNSYVNSKSEPKAKAPDKTNEKCSDTHSKKKLHKHSKIRGNVMNIVTPVSVKATDYNTAESNVESYHGTNGSGVTTKKHHVESEKKSSNLSSERKIVLTRIERKAVCSNWKLFKEVIGKNESSTGQVPKFKRKKSFVHSHKSEMNTHTKISDKSTNSQKIVMPLEKGKQDYVRHGQINGHSTQQGKKFKNEHMHGRMKKHHSQNITNGKQDNSPDVKSDGKQVTAVTAPHNSNRLTKEIALDCEMVGTDDKTDMVARVSLVNKFGECVYDKYVAPTEKVHDYRTWVSGIRPENLKNAEDFKEVQKEVAELLRGRVLVGHALRNDLKVLFLSHPRKYTRDTQRFKLFRELANSKRPSLKKLAAAVLNVSIQEGEHSSVEDARVAMQLYMMYRKKWEKLFRKSRRKHVSKDITVSSE